jgi:hypothetical protein
VSYELEMLCAFMLGAVAPLVIVFGMKALASLPWRRKGNQLDEISRRLESIELEMREKRRRP